jgi:hypothetical protein
VIAFLAATPWGALLGRDTKNFIGMVLQRTDPDAAAYESAVAAAAVKQPSFAMKLETIDATSTVVDVVNFGARLPQEKGREYDVWVALPAQLRAACAGAADPVRRLQQVLGLPRVAARDLRVYELRVAREALARPCVGGGDLAAAACSLEPPKPLPRDADAESLRKGYDHMHFLVSQMWKSYRSGFSSNGFPFTGMGWTYDWSDVPQHVGVSEFIVDRGADIAVLGSRTPAEFCAATAASPAPAVASRQPV